MEWNGELADAVLLHIPDAEQFQAIAKSRRLRPFLLGCPGPGWLVVKKDSRKELAAMLEGRQADGRLLLDVRHKDTMYGELGGDVGAPNRWITLRARRVLDWYSCLEVAP